MLTRLRVRNFKNLESLDIELGQTVVFIGPNNSGKTSALQALALWRSGVLELERNWSPTNRSCTLNRLALTQTPVNDTRDLWRDLITDPDARMLISVEGQGREGTWSLGLEFTYANRESIYCTSETNPSEPDVTPTAFEIAMLPPMSGLAAEEIEVPSGRVDVLIGEGQTAQVLRNLCLRVFEQEPSFWSAIRQRMLAAFGVTLGDPKRLHARGAIVLTYGERGREFDIASAGRGLQQTLLLLAHIYTNYGGTLLLDEPDAHLEILRQRQTYNMLTECAAETGSQIIAASHSEIILNEAADRDVVIAFVGQPHRINDRGSQVLKALREIGFDQYYQAEIKGSVLYLEGATDLAILRALALKLKHPAAEFLDQPFVHYVANLPTAALHHFHGLREARPDLVGFALFDRLDRGLPPSWTMPVHCWRKYEIENYIANRDVMRRFAGERHGTAMEQTLDELDRAFRLLRKNPWSDDAKISEDVLPNIFADFYERLGLHNIMAKADFHVLVNHLEPHEIDPEVTEVLDKLDATLRLARPASTR